MGYYSGDYYSGDYYSGDPGILSMGLGLLRRGSRFLPGPIGAVSRVVSKYLPHARKAAAVILPPVVSGVAGAAVESKISRMGSPQMSMTMPGMGAMAPPGAAMMGGMRGFHMSKPRYAPPGRMHGGALIPPHLVRNRRMRATNPRALRRALRRAHGFARLARKVMTFPIMRPPKGRGLFKKGHKRK